MKYKYFSYCPEDGFDTHETLEDALLNANGIIPNYLDEGWSEDVTGVFVGTITHAATMCDKVERAGEVDEHGYDEDGEHWPDPDWEYKCNYKMLPAESNYPALVPAEPTSAMCEAGASVPLKNNQSEEEWIGDIYRAMIAAYRKQGGDV